MAVEKKKEEKREEEREKQKGENKAYIQNITSKASNHK